MFDTEIRFDGRVAVVTGAGRALGRAHAMLLAERGAKVVVNDFGGGPDGAGGDTSVAQTVVAEIVARGGDAVANTGDVSNQSDAQAMVAATIDNYGLVDIVINNAGIMTGAPPRVWRPRIRDGPRPCGFAIEERLAQWAADAHYRSPSR
jgi:NAD(P)-dependent dehydrogenase (short-subunit alcohol dehydrogenase family)